MAVMYKVGYMLQSLPQDAAVHDPTEEGNCAQSLGYWAKQEPASAGKQLCTSGSGSFSVGVGVLVLPCTPAPTDRCSLPCPPSGSPASPWHPALPSHPPPPRLPHPPLLQHAPAGERLNQGRCSSLLLSLHPSLLTSLSMDF